MKQFKNIIIEKLGEPDVRDTIIENVLLPINPKMVSYEFDPTKIIGAADNFRLEGNNLMCDIDLFENQLDKVNPFPNIAISGYTKNIKENRKKKVRVLKDFEILDISMVACNTNLNLNNNLNKENFEKVVE